MEVDHSLAVSAAGQVTTAAALNSGDSQQAPDKSTVLAVLQLLRKYNLKRQRQSGPLQSTPLHKPLPYSNTPPTSGNTP
ncbi:hypothetical protein J6590_075919 [Homalodisca vitripennis]|nr:hypothetical protein J6590_075919 [Homalodisca vitripennis]